MDDWEYIYIAPEIVEQPQVEQPEIESNLIFKTLIITKEQVELARMLCKILSWEAGDNMLNTPLWVDNEITHYISSWYISKNFELVLSDPNILYSVCLDNWIDITLKQCEDLLLASDISEEEPL